MLLAEDNEVNMEITTELLAMNGVQVTQAWNGREAMELSGIPSRLHSTPF